MVHRFHEETQEIYAKTKLKKETVMKQFIFLIALTHISLCTLTHASTLFTYDEKAVGLANALLHCGTELNALLDEKGRIVAADLAAPRPSNRNMAITYYTLKIVSDLDEHKIWTKQLGNLQIKETIEHGTGSTTKVTYQCEITHPIL